MTGAVERTADLARELAPELRSVVLTHYPDAETLDLMRPGEETLDTVRAMNRAVAAEMLRQGVAVLVQQADRASFRRWMDGRADTAGTRRVWRDRRRLLAGPEALRLLGLEPPRPTTSRPEKNAGTPADRLARLFAGEDGAAFDACAEALIAQARDGVLEQAVRKVAQRHGEEAAQELMQDLLALAEAAPVGPSGWASLVALPVALPPGPVPDPLALAESLQAAGTLPDTVELLLLPQWRDPAAIASLTPGQLRQSLLSLAAGEEPAHMPPADGAALAEGGFGVLVGLERDWDVPLWEEIAIAGLPEPPAEDAPPAPEDEARALAFDRWRGAMFESQGGCVPLALVPLSEVQAEIEDFLEEAGEQTGGLQDIRNFIDMARQEAAGETVACLPEIDGERLHLTLYTHSGRLLDRITLEADRLPVPAAEMPPLLEAMVPLLRRPPH